MPTFARYVPYADGSVRADDVIEAASLAAILNMFTPEAVAAWEADATFFQSVPEHVRHNAKVNGDGTFSNPDGSTVSADGTVTAGADAPII